MIKLYSIYPDLLNLYGESASLTALQRTLLQCGYETEIVPVPFGETPTFTEGGLIHIGAGTENRLTYGAAAMEAWSDGLKAAMEQGSYLLLTGSAAELACQTVRHTDGRETKGLGLCDAVAVRTKTRQTGDVLYRMSGEESLLASFLNKSCYLQGVDTPAFTAILGEGGILDSAGKLTDWEGIATEKMLATFALGPLFMRNPWLKRCIAAKLTGDRRILSLPPDAADFGYSVTVDALKARISANSR